MSFNYEEFKRKEDELIDKEQQNINLKKELETFQELLNISAEERKNTLSNMINDIIENIKSNNLVIQENKIYIKEQQFEIGKEIKDYLHIIREEINDYTLGDNKALFKLKKSVDNISEYLKEINIYIKILEDLNNENIKSNIIENFNKDKIEDSETGDKEFPNYIISKSYEFSAFLPNNKTGYSLKSFFNQHKQQIEEVLIKFNGDKNRTIKYFQRIHGLYGNEPILENTINSLFSNVGLNARKTRIGVKINNVEILGNSDFEIFINVIEHIGLEKIYNNCKSIFDKSFTISKVVLKHMHGKHKEVIQNNQLYYLYINSSTESKYAKLNNINKILKDNFILYYK